MDTRFHIHDRFGVQMWTFAQYFEALFEQVRVERRIEKHDIPRTIVSAQEVERRCALNGAVGCADGARAFLQRANNDWIVVDECRRRCAARQRLESERTGPGEQIETTSAVEPRRQPIEHGLTRAIRRGT